MAVEKKKPRVRKIETVRDRNEKVSAKAAAQANKVKNRPVRKVARAIGKPLKKPASAVARPFKVRPVRFVFRWLGRILVPLYFRNSYKELRQVSWPGRRETWKLTFAVLIFATVFGLMIFVVDLGMDKIIKRIVLR